jgi:hypothetical protein
MAKRSGRSKGEDVGILGEASGDALVGSSNPEIGAHAKFPPPVPFNCTSKPGQTHTSSPASAFGIPSTPEWRALGELAHVARQNVADEPERAQKLATLRQIVLQAYRTQPMPARPR